MKRRFTILTAALALLTFLAVPMGMWGQTTVTWPGTAALPGTATAVGNDQNITIMVSSTNNYTDPIRVYANTTITIEAKNSAKITSVTYESYSTGNYVTVAQTATVTPNVTPTVSGKNVTWTYAESANVTTFTFKPTAQTRCNSISITYVGSGGPALDTYTVTYHSNVTGTADVVETYNEGDDVTVAANTFTNPGYAFTEWNTESDGSGDSYEPEDVINDIDGDIDLYAQWEVSTSTTGNIKFGSSSGHVAINAVSVTDDDDLGNEWTITTVGTSSFTQSSIYSQVGSSNNPASSITFTTTLPEEVNVTAMEAKFGGFSGTAGTITLKVGNTTIGTGSLNAGNDVIVNSTSTETGDALTVTVTGISKGVKAYYISYTYEAATPNPAVATTTTINVPANFNTDIYTSTTAGTLTATVTENVDNTAISGTTVTWSSSNTGVATIDANGEVTLVAVGTTTITASYAGVEDVYRPSEATYVLTVIDSNAPGSQNNPYTVAQAIANTPSSGTSNNVYIHGYVSRFHNNSIVGDGSNYRYYISDDGTTNTELLVYKGKGLNNVAFSSANDLLIGDEVTIYGGLTTYNGTKEIAANNYIVSLVRPNQYTLTAAMTNVAEYFVFVGDDAIEFDENDQAQVTAGSTVYVSLTMEDCYALTSLTVNGSTTGVTEEEPGVYYSFVMPEGNAAIGVSATQATEYTLTMVGTENVTFDMLAGADSDPVTLTNGTASLCEQMFVLISNLTANSGLVLQSVTLTAGGSATTLTPEYGVYTFNMPSSDATLTFTTATAPTYTLASSIESGKQYIIVGQADGDYYAMGDDNTNNRKAYGITLNGTTAIATVESGANVHEFTITSLATPGFYSICDAITPGYLYAASSSKNYLKTETTLDEDHNGDWEITFNSDGSASVVASSGSYTHNIMRFNNQNTLFSCYTTGQHPVYLYVKDETPATETFSKTIAAVGNNNWAEGKGGYYLIASPLADDVNPATVGMITEDEGDVLTYDLYSFDQGEDDEWRNYRENTFDLVNGKGYLYASKNGVTLTFTGVPGTNGEVTLRVAENADGFGSYNLVGNPFGVDAYINKPFYTLENSDTYTYKTAGDTIHAMQGLLVVADNNGETLTFSTTPSKKVAKLNMNVSKGQCIVDHAIISFSEGQQLPKLQFRKGSTKVYMPMEGKDYAIVSTESNMGEMPVNFKAENNGTYTLSFTAEEVSFAYLHLIDNMTGIETDLLANPSYSFEAKTTDYESRFKLVFATGNNSNDDAFAFYSNGSFVINNEGEATLQVIDINGRILKSESINGCANINVNAAQGIYMLRLVNGENVMVQKVVVR